MLWNACFHMLPRTVSVVNVRDHSFKLWHQSWNFRWSRVSASMGWWVVRTRVWSTFTMDWDRSVLDSNRGESYDLIYLQEFLMVREQYQTAIDKLEHLALSSKEPLTNNSGDFYLVMQLTPSVSAEIKSTFSSDEIQSHQDQLHQLSSSGPSPSPCPPKLNKSTIKGKRRILTFDHPFGLKVSVCQGKAWHYRLQV